MIIQRIESNTDPYKFEVPTFDDINFDFGPDNHKELVESSGLYKKPKESTKKETRECIACTCT